MDLLALLDAVGELVDDLLGALELGDRFVQLLIDHAIHNRHELGVLARVILELAGHALRDVRDLAQLLQVALLAHQKGVVELVEALLAALGRAVPLVCDGLPALGLLERVLLRSLSHALVYLQ